MSVRRAQKLAVVEFVREMLGKDHAVCDVVAAPGKPRPDCGDLFVGVWGGSRTWTMDTAAEYQMSVNLTVTIRLTQPMTRWDVALVDEADGLDQLMDRLASLLYRSQNEIRARADALLPPELSGIYHAPRPMSDEEPQPVGADWFTAEPGGGKGDGLVYGLKATLVYGDWAGVHPTAAAEL